MKTLVEWDKAKENIIHLLTTVQKYRKTPNKTSFKQED